MDNQKKAVSILRHGGIVIFPTDTAYGIGCRIDNEKSVKRLYSLRNKPAEKAVPILASSFEMAQKYYSTPLPDIVRHLMKNYWPGALTIIYTRNSKTTPLLVCGNHEKVGIRIPDHKKMIEVIQKVGVPIIGTSANFYQHPTCYSFKDLDPKLVELADFVLKGNCKLGNVSTVVDCSKDSFRIVRQGAVQLKNKI